MIHVFVSVFQADLLDWLRMLKLDCYYETLMKQGFDNIDFVTDITWEDLEEIGIQQLGTGVVSCSAITK